MVVWSIFGGPSTPRRGPRRTGPIQAKQARRVEADAQLLRKYALVPERWSPTICDHTAQPSMFLGSNAGMSAGDGVESTTGAVAVGTEEWLFAGCFRTLPVPQFGPWLRFQSPLVKPDVRISRIQLSPVPSNLRCGFAGRCRGRASHKDTRAGSGRTRCLCVPIAVATSDGLVARCICG
jgi:hypothetical protein